jgi:hypothetical protein
MKKLKLLKFVGMLSVLVLVASCNIPLVPFI